MKNGKNIRGALSYNEAKVRAGDAELILAARFGCEIERLSFSQKVNRFEKLNQHCIRSSYSAVHISLNFHPDERLSIETLQAIAQDYMQQLGFEKQPYLVYRHDDAGHPHLHIVTTPVKPNGRIIPLHNLVQRKSEPARKNIEITYGLIQAEGRMQQQSFDGAAIEKASYGKSATKQSIARVVRSVMRTYHYTSLEEYKLIVREYGVFADTGAPGTRLNRNGGLQYFLCDSKGNKTGVPVKASDIYDSPTRKNLSLRFERNGIRKSAILAVSRISILYCCNQSRSRQDFINRLGEHHICVTADEHGKPVLIDHNRKIVCTAKELGIEKEVQKALDGVNWPSIDLAGVTLTLLQQLAATTCSGPELDGAFLKRRKKKKKR